MLKDLIVKNRSYRRFREEAAIERETLTDLIELARLSPSTANRQPLKFWISCDPQTNSRIFPHLGWAGYLKDWPGPAEGERPAAYIVILADTDISANVGCDHGIAAQSIVLGAVEQGLGGCMIGSIRKEELREAVRIPARYKILLVIALGVPQETVVLEAVNADNDIQYWRDAADVHHVPKRALDTLVLDFSS